MGHCRAGSQPLGGLAVMQLRANLAIITLGVCAVGSLAGCSVIATLPGITAGAATSSVTGNPALGLTVAVATNAAVDAGVKYVMKRFSAAEQQEIANAIAQSVPGQERRWRVEQPIPYGNNKGRTIVVSESVNALTTCKKALFSVEGTVDGKPAEHWYTLDVCKNGQYWLWAQAEPSVKRWGSLH